MSGFLRMAYFSPLPPARTGIADYSRELLPAILQHAEVTLFAEHPEEVDLELARSCPVRPIHAYASDRWAYDIALYQMGNSMYHAAIYRALLQHPGVVVLHEHSLHHLMVAHTIGQGDSVAYVREMGYAHGLKGTRLAREAIRGSCPYPFFEIPLNERMLDASLGVIVHSRYLQAQIQRQRPELPAHVVPAPTGLHAASSRRRELGWPEDSFVFASVGQATASKQVDLILRTLARLRDAVPRARCLIVGDWLQPDMNLPERVKDLGLGDAVKHLGFIENIQDFVDWVATADAVLNLRYPTVGETSASALRALAVGRPVIVFDHGWYSELPDDVCLKVKPMDEEALLAGMRRLAEDSALRARMGRQADVYSRQHHHPSRTAEAYVHFIRELLSGLSSRFTGDLHA